MRLLLAAITLRKLLVNASGLAATKPELRVGVASGLREYKAVYVQNDAEIGLFSDEVVVNCAP